MLEPRYRIQTEGGLSVEYSLDDLRRKSASGSVGADAECTNDGGSTWVTVGSVLESEDMSAVATQTIDPSGPNMRDLSPSDSTTTNVDGLASTRKLKRINKAEGESKFAKRRADREQRKATGKVLTVNDLIGAELADGRYTVKSMLGKGSMAYVFLVSDGRLETDAVVKVPKPEKFTTADFRERFKRECQLLVRFSHPHVVGVLDVGEYGALPYVVMQLLSGGSLTDRMAKEADAQGRMAPQSLKSWVREVGRALDFCFRKGMVHRDVKPANILFDEDHNPYVADFGLSKVMYGEHEDLNSSETAAGIVLGTPNYISPEIVLGQSYDGRADQYSLGITIYHALTGKPPMQGNSATATMVNQTQTVLDLLSDVRPDVVSRPLAMAIKKGIEKDPNKRFATSEEFAEAVLEGLRVPVGKRSVAGTSSSGTNTSPSQRKASSSSGKRASKAGGAAAKPQADRPANSGATTRPSKNTASAKVAGALEGDMDWFDMSDESSSTSSRSNSGPKSRPQRRAAAAGTAALPPRKGGTKRKKTEKRSTKSTGLGLFGMNVHPVVAIGICAGLAMLLIGVVIYRFTRPDEPVTFADHSELSAMPGDSNNDSHSTDHDDGARRDVEQAADAVPEPEIAASVNVASENSSQAESFQVAMGEPVALGTRSANPVDNTSRRPGSQNPDAVMAEQRGAELLMSDSADVVGGASRFVTIPFEPSEGFTVGVADCPILLSGNRVWDKGAQSVRHRLEGTFDGRAQTALSPDGRLFAAASKPPGQQNTAVTVWDTQTGGQLFTAAGESKRFTDVILLSSTTLYIGDRWSEELLVWNCETGSKGKSIKLEEAKFKRGNAAISQDGQYIAAMAQGRMVILNTADGNLGGLMQNPGNTVRMKRGSLKSSRPRKKNPDVGNDAEPVFAAMQSLAFSVDNQQLAGFSTFPRSRFMAWNSKGELTADRAAASTASGTQGGAFQWFDAQDAWLVSGNILERETGRVVLTTLSDNANRTSTSVYDDQHLVSVLRNSPTELSIIPIPWETIATSLPQIKNTEAALLAVGSSVSLQVSLLPLFERGSTELNDVRKAMNDNLKREGLKIENESRTVFRIGIAKTSEGKTSVLNRFVPVKQRSDAARIETLPDDDCVVLELLTSPDSTDPVWRVNLGSLSGLGLSDTPKRVAADKLMTLVDELNFPYFVPHDETSVGLPIVID